MTVLHRHLFCPPTTSDEEKDLAIQKRYGIVSWYSCFVDTLPNSNITLSLFCLSFSIRQLNWVSAKHLDCRIIETSEEVRDLVYTSITGEHSMLCACKYHVFIVLEHHSTLIIFRSAGYGFWKSTSGQTTSCCEMLPKYFFTTTVFSWRTSQCRWISTSSNLHCSQGKSSPP